VIGPADEVYYRVGAPVVRRCLQKCFSSLHPFDVSSSRALRETARFGLGLELMTRAITSLHARRRTLGFVASGSCGRCGFFLLSGPNYGLFSRLFKRRIHSAAPALAMPLTAHASAIPPIWASLTRRDNGCFGPGVLHRMLYPESFSISMGGQPPSCRCPPETRTPRRGSS